MASFLDSTEGTQSDPGVCTLAEMSRGCPARIVGFSCDDKTSRRLCDIGFAPGRIAKLTRTAPLRDPLMFDVAGTEIVVRRREARLVLVESGATLPLRP